MSLAREQFSKAGPEVCDSLSSKKILLLEDKQVGRSLNCKITLRPASVSLAQ